MIKDKVLEEFRSGKWQAKKDTPWTYKGKKLFLKYDSIILRKGNTFQLDIDFVYKETVICTKVVQKPNFENDDALHLSCDNVCLMPVEVHWTEKELLARTHWHKEKKK